VRSSIPAVTHVDYSATVQTVRRDTNPIVSEYRTPATAVAAATARVESMAVLPNSPSSATSTSLTIRQIIHNGCSGPEHGPRHQHKRTGYPSDHPNPASQPASWAGTAEIFQQPARLHLAAFPGGGLTPAAAPLIDAEILFRQLEPPYTNVRRH
jgi:hypothetical protein